MLMQDFCPAEDLTERSPRPEQHAIVRYLCDRKVAYSPLVTRQRLWARVRTVSVQGIRLLLSTPIKPDTDLVIEIRTADSDISFTLVARVLNATMQEEGSWIVDCKFLTSPTEEQLLALL